MDCGLFFVLLPFYEACLSGERGGEVRAQLLDLLGVVDRLHGEEQQLAEEMLFALLLLPWARATLGLGEDALKGQEAANFARQLREALDVNLASLNIKRATRETVTCLLVNLPAFARCAGSGSFPKWLQRKSYFKDVAQFHAMVREAGGGEPVAEVTVQEPRSEERRSTRKRSSGNRSSRQPAFAKGGIFGLKK